MSELKACPFCGSKAEIEDWKIGYEIGTTIICRGCNACISESVVDGDGWHKRAVAKWNHRAQSANEQLTCKGCEYQESFENEREYGYPSPCNACIRVAFDNYRRKPEPEGRDAHDSV